MTTSDARELWWIYSPMVRQPWAGLRLATFFKAADAPDMQLVIIHNEIQDRMGVRHWAGIRKTELWYRVRQIEPPNMAEVLAASLKDIEDD
jgi:hypothetical protein